MPAQFNNSKDDGVLFRLFRRAFVIAFLLIVALAFSGCVWIFEAAVHGPYTTWYNNRCERLARRAHLVGKPESDVENVLGRATEVWRYKGYDGHDVTTYNYAPCPFWAGGLYQVHCREGRVHGTELLDD